MRSISTATLTGMLSAHITPDEDQRAAARALIDNSHVRRYDTRTFRRFHLLLEIDRLLGGQGEDLELSRQEYKQGKYLWRRRLAIEDQDYRHWGLGLCAFLLKRCLRTFRQQPAESIKNAEEFESATLRFHTLTGKGEDLRRLARLVVLNAIRIENGPSGISPKLDQLVPPSDEYYAALFYFLRTACLVDLRDLKCARESARTSLALFRRSVVREQIAWATLDLAMVENMSGNESTAIQLLDKLSRSALSRHNREINLATRICLANCLMASKDAVAAREALGEEPAISDSIAVRWLWVRGLVEYRLNATRGDFFMDKASGAATSDAELAGILSDRVLAHLKGGKIDIKATVELSSVLRVLGYNLDAKAVSTASIRRAVETAQAYVHTLPVSLRQQRTERHQLKCQS